LLKKKKKIPLLKNLLKVEKKEEAAAEVLIEANTLSTINRPC